MPAKPFTYKKLFLIDGLGALLSAFLLGVVLVRFQSTFGIPVNTLYLLAATPVVFAFYDLYCYFSQPKNPAPFLKAIAFANLAYCVLSLALAYSHQQELTLLGWAYIVGEVFIVVGLAIFELRFAGSKNTTPG